MSPLFTEKKTSKLLKSTIYLKTEHHNFYSESIVSKI